MTVSIFPDNYIPTSQDSSTTSRYFKPSNIKENQPVTLRLCGTPSTGHVICGFKYFTMEGRPRLFPQFPKDYLADIGLTYEGKKNNTGEKDKPVYFLSWACLIKGFEDFQIIEITQVKIREQIEAVLAMDDYTIEPGEMANFYLTISRTGAGKDTKYNVVPTLKVATQADQKRWAGERDNLWLPALFEGGDPFAGRPSGSPAPTTQPMTSRDELGADRELGTGEDW